MPTPLAHGLMGAVVLAALPLRRQIKFDWRNVLLGALLGIAPDFDCLLGYLPFAPFAGRGWHHDFTHSLGFALLCGWACAWLWQNAETRLRAGLVYSAAMATHPLLDFLFTDSQGVELLWPLSHAYMRMGWASPTAFVWNRPTMLGWLIDVSQAALVELCLFGSVFLFVWLLRQLVWRKAPPAGEAALFEE